MTDTDKNSPVDFSDFNAFMWDCHKARQTKMHNDYLYMFYVEMSKPLDPSDYNNGWVTLYIKYEMSRFSLYAGITDKPLPDFRELSKGFIEIPQTFADQIKTNQSFIKTLTIRLNEYAKTRGKEGASFDKVFDVLKTKQISVQRNNSIAKAMEHNKKLDMAHKAHRDEIKAAAKSAGGNQEWGYYREYYRGPNSPAHDDDYEGSGTLSFEDVAVTLCKTVEDVKKLANAPVGTRIVDVVDHYRIYYSRRK